jgi:hypothetical protein
MFVYKITKCSPEQLSLYKTSQGDYYWESEDDNTPLWQTANYIGESATLVQTKSGNWIADLGAFEKASSLAKRLGVSFKDALDIVKELESQAKPQPKIQPPQNNVSGSEFSDF